MDETQAAVQRLKQGDIGGLETLFARCQVRAVRSAFLILQDEAAAQDVVQDTFLRIYQRIRHFDETQPFEPYLLRSVAHASLNAAQRAARTLHFDDDLHEIESLLDGSDPPEAQIEAGQRSESILAALARLSPRQRAAIVQRYYLDMSEREMSASLQVTPGTVKWLLSAARARLRALLHPLRSERRDE